MSNRMRVGLFASILLALGAVAVAQQRDSLPPTTGSAEPAAFALPSVSANAPEASDLLPIVPDSDLIGSSPPSSEAPDANAFISAGTKQAAGAIETLSAERERLLARLKTVDEELARWNAIRDGLSLAKGILANPDPTLMSYPRITRPGESLPRITAPGEVDNIQLEPLPEPSGR